MLRDEIDEARKLVKTDAYQMSIGEIVSMYKDGDLVITPDFQRLFRWHISQKSRLIESILLGIPLPSIFVFETEQNKWELIDGLQRISTILEFMGLLVDPDNKAPIQPSTLVKTKYLPSLDGAVWEKFGNDAHQKPFEREMQLAIRRARIGVEILKQPSDLTTKYELFQRLNAGGTQANPQELRNCMIIMASQAFFEKMKSLVTNDVFKRVFGITADQITKQKHMEFATRFMVNALIPYDGKKAIEEYMDDGLITIAEHPTFLNVESIFIDTINLLDDALEGNALRRIEDTKPVGRVGLAAIECIAVGVAANLKTIKAKKKPAEFVKSRILKFWQQPELDEFTRAGLTGTVRIGMTVPFGKKWFK